MKNSIINALKFTLFTILFMLPLAVIFLIVFNAGWFNSLPLALRYGIGAGVIGISVAILIIAPKTHLLDGVLKSAFEKDEKAFERYDVNNRKEIERFSIDKEKYRDITRVYSQLNRVKGMPFIMISIAMSVYFIILSNQLNIVVLFFILSTAVLIYNYFGRVIKISPEGIRSASLFRNQLIKWEKVKTIGVSSSGGPFGKNNIDSFIWVYVSTRVIKSRHIVTSGKEHKGFITFKFRAKMIHHMLCYYDNEIVNLHNVRRWRRYIEKYGSINTEVDSSSV